MQLEGVFITWQRHRGPIPCGLAAGSGFTAFEIICKSDAIDIYGISLGGMFLGSIIEVKNVSKIYGKTVALNQIDLNLELGSIIGLLGPNGSGKTTLLKLLLHIIRPNEGSMKINGENIVYETRKYISYMPDREFLYDTMTVNDAINYYIDMFDDFDKESADYLCEKLDLERDQEISKLSKGNKEKANLMLTLSRITKIYLLDEPLGSLDPLIKHQMLQVIQERKSEDNLILIATHLIKDTEEILDKVIFLKKGNIELIKDMKEIKQEMKTLDEYYLEVFANA